MADFYVGDLLPYVGWAADEDLGSGQEFVARLELGRAAEWGALSGRGLEIFRYAEAARVLRGREFFTPFGRLSDRSGLHPEDGWIYFHMERMLAGVAGPEHVALKGIFLEFFGPRAVEKWRPHVAEIINDLTREAEKTKRFDLARDVCLQLPARLFCRLINRPDEDAVFLAKTSNEILKIFEQSPKNRETILQAGAAMKAYTDTLVEDRKAKPGDDLVSYLISKHNEGKLTEEELTHNVAMLLEASVDNTGNQFALTMMHLLTEPSRWQAIVSNSEQVRPAIDESIRFTPKVNTINRIVADDMIFNGQPLKKGTWISVSVLAAHRDPTAFPDADVYDMNRGITRQPLVFGGGMHMCLGMLLSLVELDEGIKTLARNFPNLRLAGEVKWTMNATYTTVESLPVTIE